MNNYSKIACYDFEDKGNNVWLCLNDKNAICVIDKLSRYGKVIGEFPQEDSLSHCLSSSVVCVGSKLVFLPYAANQICVYDINEEKNIYIEIPTPRAWNRIKYKKNKNFLSGFPYRNYCYLIGATYPGIVRLNVENGEMVVLDGFIQDIDEKIDSSNNVYFSRGYALIDSTVYLGFTCCNALLKLNLETNEYSVISINCDFKGFSGICLMGDVIWITDFSKSGDSVIQYDINTGVIHTVKMPFNDRLWMSISIDKKLYSFPVGNKRRIICYDTLTGNWNSFEELNDSLPESMGIVISSKVVGDSVIGVFGGSKKWFKIQNDRITLFDYYIDSDSFLMYLRNSSSSLFRENEYDLSLFLNWVTKDC